MPELLPSHDSCSIHILHLQAEFELSLQVTPFPRILKKYSRIKPLLAKNIDRILIVRTDRIGDVILTLPMAKVLKREFPAAHITMLIQQYTSQLVEDNRDVDKVLFYDRGDHPIPFFQLVHMLRREKFDVVFHTHPRFRLTLITWLARIPVRVGTGYRWYSFLFNKKVYEHRKTARRHELEYNLNLLQAIGCAAAPDIPVPTIDVDPAAVVKVKEFLSEAGIPDGSRLVVLHPGSGNSARDWPAEKFGLLGQCLARLPNVRMIISGGKSEGPVVRTVKNAIGKSAVEFVGTLSLREFAALARLSSLFIANSTGPLHIAASVGTPVIGLYPQITALSAERWGPYTAKKTIFTPNEKPTNCRKCVRGKSAGCECMDSICVEDVYSAASRWLGVDKVG